MEEHYYTMLQQLYPINNAIELFKKMVQYNYSFTTRDVDGISPLFILKCNYLKSYQNINIRGRSDQFKRISRELYRFEKMSSLAIYLQEQNFPQCIALIIGNYVPLDDYMYDINYVKFNNADKLNEYVNNWIPAVYEKGTWELMIKQQKKRLLKKGPYEREQKINDFNMVNENTTLQLGKYDVPTPIENG